jgi:hypothetical protein
MALVTATASVAVLGITAAQAASPADKCEAAKLKIAGKYDFCRLKAEATAAKTGGMPDFSKCDAAFSAKWMSAETAGAGMCPTMGDAALIQATITTHTNAIEAALDPCSAGQIVGGFCWLLGNAGLSCDTVCTSVGKTCDPATISYAGSGGSDANCQAVLNALGVAGPLTLPSDPCSPAVGCSFDGTSITTRCATPTTTCNAAAYPLLRACACL